MSWQHVTATCNGLVAMIVRRPAAGGGERMQKRGTAAPGRGGRGVEKCTLGPPGPAVTIPRACNARACSARACSARACSASTSRHGVVRRTRGRSRGQTRRSHPNSSRRRPRSLLPCAPAGACSPVPRHHSRPPTREAGGVRAAVHEREPPPRAYPPPPDDVRSPDGWPPDSPPGLRRGCSFQSPPPAG